MKTVMKIFFTEVLLIVAFFAIQPVFAQTDADLVAEADAAYTIGAKLLALDNYELALKANPNNIRANFMAGKCIIETIEKGRASKYLIKAYELDPNVSTDVLFLIGQSFQYGREFDNATVYYLKYKEKLLADPNAKKLKGTKTLLAKVDDKITQCSNGKKYMEDPLEYTIKSLGEGINTSFADYAPAINKDETMIVFTSRREGGVGIGNVDSDLMFFEDIYVSYFKDGEWQTAKNIGTKINTEFHDASIGLSGDGKEMYLYKDENGGDIYVSHQKSDSTWTTPETISENINSTYNENSVSISPDGQTLFFTSDRPGGKGGIDIYYSKLDKKGHWGRAMNMGTPINTAADEDGPFIDYDGKTLYFSSRGHQGMGGYDIFVAEYDSVKNKWSEPVNIGYPINTPDDDIYFVKSGDKKYGYYASVKDGGMGEKDIYKVLIPENIQQYNALKFRKIEGKKTNMPTVAQILQPVLLRVQVIDENNVRMNAKVIVRSKGVETEVGVKLAANGIYQSSFSNTTEQRYIVSIEEDGYMFKNLEVVIPAMTETEQIVNKDVVLSKLDVGFRAILRNIYFDFNQATFKQESYPELNKLARMMKENPTYRVEIAGHTDFIGGIDYNKELSQQRATAVVDFLIKKGIDASRLVANGYGEEKPLATNDDEKEGREINRRTEFKVMGDH
jgi:outer membrane protein OmpA-like peptidoglycan-associated protein/tetratricopeptide (TPR) repeat protein